MPKKKKAKKAGPELVPWSDRDLLLAMSWLLDQEQLKPHRTNVKIADWERLAAKLPGCKLDPTYCFGSGGRSSRHIC